MRRVHLEISDVRQCLLGQGGVAIGYFPYDYCAIKVVSLFFVA